MEKARGGRARFDPERIVMSGGATGAQETIAFCLANPGDAFLIPTPYYPAYVCLLSQHSDLSSNCVVNVPVRTNVPADQSVVHDPNDSQTFIYLNIDQNHTIQRNTKEQH